MNPSTKDQEYCSICPRNCRVDRRQNLGYCGKENEIEINWYGAHFGEEPPFSGVKGSGAIFFSGCNLSCVYCQNWQISQGKIPGKKYSIDEVVEIFLDLQNKKYHNINLVSPTVWTLQLIKVIKKAKKKGLLIPIVWNSNAYEKVETLKKLKGLVSIYLPDYKYSQPLLGRRLSRCEEYPEIAQKAILEMYRQVGDLKINQKGIAEKGIIIRHLVLPGKISNTKGCLQFIRDLSFDIHLSLMSQYRPAFKALKILSLNRGLKKDEYNKVKALVKQMHFKDGWFQELSSTECLNPDFRKKRPFWDKTW